MMTIKHILQGNYKMYTNSTDVVKFYGWSDAYRIVGNCDGFGFIVAELHAAV